MDLIILGAFFSLGFVFGVLTLTILTVYFANRSVRKREFEAEESLKKENIIVEKMLKVKELTALQLAFQADLQSPQRSGLDGVHKNDLNNQIKRLEDEKMAILQSILADGCDPIITVNGSSGTTENVKLSEFMSKNGLLSPPLQDNTTPGGPKRIGKFVVYSGKTDGNGGGETVH